MCETIKTQLNCTIKKTTLSLSLDNQCHTQQFRKCKIYRSGMFVWAFWIACRITRTNNWMHDELAKYVRVSRSHVRPIPRRAAVKWKTCTTHKQQAQTEPKKPIIETASISIWSQLFTVLRVAGTGLGISHCVQASRLMPSNEWTDGIEQQIICVAHSAQKKCLHMCVVYAHVQRNTK